MAQNSTLPPKKAAVNSTGSARYDVLVEWTDGSRNVVSSKDLSFGKPLHHNQHIRMKWGKTWWRGKVLNFEQESCNKSSEELSEETSSSEDTGDDSDSDMDDVPLIQLKSHTASEPKSSNGSGGSADSENDMDDVPLAQLQAHLISKGIQDFDQMITTPCENAAAPVQLEVTPAKLQTDHQDDVMSKPQICSDFSCKEEIFAACGVCQCLLCFEHFMNPDNYCANHNLYFSEFLESESASVAGVGQIDNNTPTLLGDTSMLIVEEINIDNASQSSLSQQPEDFVVEGEERIEIQPEVCAEQTCTTSRNVTVKTCRNKGESYYTEKTNRFVSKRKGQDKQRCKSAFCQVRSLACQSFKNVHRASLKNAFYELGDLSLQRQWISRHIEIKEHDKNTRKKIAMKYFFPLDEGQTTSKKLQVCKVMFLNTLGISERQVRTVIRKTGPLGMLETEKRGGRRRKDKDQCLADEVCKHIDRFPKMESHFCRSSTAYQYLSPDLNISKMYRLYLEEHHKSSRKDSLSFYTNTFKKMKLKFHTPKKDLCGLCETYRKGTEVERRLIGLEYEKHIQEKCKSRELKDEMKKKAIENPDTFVASVFDLEQVLYLPKSGRGELFYKRRLSCYNFTVYELASKKGYCYLHHEGLAKRGSNEIASNLYSYLKGLEGQNKKDVVLFCDGCRGQNKNSILPAMLMHFVKHSKSVNSVAVYYFETNHGQSEGDAMHSTVERSMKNFGDIFHPSQLATLFKLARRNPFPYVIKEVQTQDILDWKQLSRDMHILRVRKTVEGEPVAWTKVMQIRIQKNRPGQIMVNFSHCDTNHSTIAINEGQRQVGSQLDLRPSKAYARGPPKLSDEKYNDLMNLCKGNAPVICHPDHVSFYRQLPH